MSFLRVPLFTLISHYLLLHLRFCKAYQNCLFALVKTMTAVTILPFQTKSPYFQEISYSSFKMVRGSLIFDLLTKKIIEKAKEVNFDIIFCEHLLLEWETWDRKIVECLNQNNRKFSIFFNGENFGLIFLVSCIIASWEIFDLNWRCQIISLTGRMWWLCRFTLTTWNLKTYIHFWISGSKSTGSCCWHLVWDKVGVGSFCLNSWNILYFVWFFEISSWMVSLLVIKKPAAIIVVGNL